MNALIKFRTKFVPDVWNRTRESTAVTVPYVSILLVLQRQIPKTINLGFFLKAAKNRNLGF